MTTKKTSRTTNHAKPAPNTLAWLTATNRKGVRRISTLSWGRLNSIYRSRKADRAVRRAIEHEARRCGYQPQTILSLNAWQ